MKEKIPRCYLYPKDWEEPICKAGADTSTTNHYTYECSEEYSDTCFWFLQYLKENS